MTARGTRFGSFLLGVPIAIVLVAAARARAADTVPAEIVQPGTQPGQVAAFATNCDSCHYVSNAQAVASPELSWLPARGWHGSMMSHSMRDPLFWATVAVAEQDFLPAADPAARGGVGDLCLRCHGPNGWLGGRSTPTNGSAYTGTDARGVECEHCHLQVNPDPPVNVAGTVETYPAGFEPYDADTGEAFRGSAQYVINGNGTRLGPYTDAAANHAFFPSAFHRSGDLCGTCHDVSNPAVGDLAHDHGATFPLEDGSFSGVPGGPIADKVAFRQPPYRYGVVERTYSEWRASALDTLRVSDFTGLPEELRNPTGSLAVARGFAVAARPDGDYADGTPRTFTCQTCHMSPRHGKGCDKSAAPVRTDVPWHDQTGAAHWLPDALAYQADHATLRFGTLDDVQRAALTAGKQRAIDMIRSAAALDLVAAGETLRVRIDNLTGHKLISGYPEGRRLWLNLRWLDAGGAVLAEHGRYGDLVRPAFPTLVRTLLDPEDTLVIEARPGIDREWAAQLLALGYDPDLPLTYDPVTDAVQHTLGELGDAPAGTRYHSFHFVLNNVLLSDNRIPPYGFAWDEAERRNTLPVPDRQYGGRGAGTVFNHSAVAAFPVPVGAASVEIRLFYQQTSWEYIQFLWLANDGQDTFLGQEGVNLLDAWRNTGMAEPVEITSAVLGLDGLPPAPGEPSAPGEEPMRAGYDRATGTISVTYDPACDATGQTVYWGDLARVGQGLYDGAVCGFDNSGTLAFDATGTGSVFFLVVARNDAVEGSYGLDSTGLERPEDTGTPVCDLPQDLSASCSDPE